MIYSGSSLPQGLAGTFLPSPFHCGAAASPVPLFIRASSCLYAFFVLFVDARHDPVRLERLLLDNATEILSILSTTSSPADDVDVTHNNHELQNDLLLLLEEPYVCSFLAQPSLISQFWPFLTIGFQCAHQRTHSLVSSIFETFATTSCCSGFHPPAAAASEVPIGFYPSLLFPWALYVPQDVHHRFIRFLLSCLIDSTNLACVEKAGRYLVATLANMSSDSLPIILSGINQDL